MEFGVRWGRDLVLLENLRSTYEPFNYNRKIIGFDTFKGLSSTTKEKDNPKMIKEGDYSVTQEYEKYLEKVLNFHESESPVSHIEKCKVVKGDVTKTLKKYLAEHPETIIALAYFDLDIYKPTKVCLDLIENHLTKGSIIGFDELNVEEFKGETSALKEWTELDNYSLKRLPISPLQSYLKIE